MRDWKKKIIKNKHCLISNITTSSGSLKIKYTVTATQAQIDTLTSLLNSNGATSIKTQLISYYNTTYTNGQAPQINNIFTIEYVPPPIPIENYFNALVNFDVLKWFIDSQTKNEKKQKMYR